MVDGFIGSQSLIVSVTWGGYNWPNFVPPVELQSGSRIRTQKRRAHGHYCGWAAGMSAGTWAGGAWFTILHHVRSWAGGRRADDSGAACGHGGAAGSCRPSAVQGVRRERSGAERYGNCVPAVRMAAAVSAGVPARPLSVFVGAGRPGDVEAAKHFSAACSGAERVGQSWPAVDRVDLQCNQAGAPAVSRCLEPGGAGGAHTGPAEDAGRLYIGRPDVEHLHLRHGKQLIHRAGDLAPDQLCRR